MNKLDELRDILNEYGHIFQNISELETNSKLFISTTIDMHNLKQSILHSEEII